MHIDDLICRLCDSLLRDPVTVKECRHHFCRECLEYRLSVEKNNQCPACNKIIEKSGHKTDPALQQLLIKMNPASALEGAKKSDFVSNSRHFCDSNEMVSFVLEYFSIPMTVELLSDDDYEEQDDLDTPSSSSHANQKKKSRKFPSPMDTIFRRYYRCPAKTPLAVFQRLLQEKLCCSDNYSIHFVHNKVNKEIKADSTLRSLATETGWLRTRPLRMMFTIIPSRDRPPQLEPEAMPCLMAEAPHETQSVPGTESPNFVSPVPALTVSISTDKNGNQAPKITTQSAVQPRAVPRRRPSDQKPPQSAAEKSPPFPGMPLNSRPMMMQPQFPLNSPQAAAQLRFNQQQQQFTQQQLQNMFQQRYMQQQLSQHAQLRAEEEKRAAAPQSPMVRAYPNLVATLQPSTSSASQAVPTTSQPNSLFPVSIVQKAGEVHLKPLAGAAARLVPVTQAPATQRAAPKPARTPDAATPPMRPVKRPADSTPNGSEKKIKKSDSLEDTAATPAVQPLHPPPLKMANVKTETPSSVSSSIFTPTGPPKLMPQLHRANENNESSVAPSPPSPAFSQPQSGPSSVPRPGSGTPSPPSISPVPRKTGSAPVGQAGTGSQVETSPQMAPVKREEKEEKFSPRSPMTSPDGNASIDIGTIAKMTGQRLGKTLKDSFLRPKSVAVEGIKTFNTGDGLQFRLAQDTLEQLKKTKILAAPVSTT